MQPIWYKQLPLATSKEQYSQLRCHKQGWWVQFYHCNPGDNDNVPGNDGHLFNIHMLVNRASCYNQWFSPIVASRLKHKSQNLQIPSSFNAWIPPPSPLPDCTWWIIWKGELPSFNTITKELFFLRIKIGLCGKGNGIWYCLRCRCSYEGPDVGDDVPDSQDACDKSDAKCLWRVQVNWGYVAPSSSDKYHLVVIM